MRTLNAFMMVLLMGLTLLFGVVASGQTASQAETKKQSDNCSLTCCGGDSCEMKGMKDHAARKGCCGGDSCHMKGMKNHSDKKGCCGDSCDMKDMRGHADKKGCCGESCEMKGSKSHAAKDKKGCCCCSDSCDMKPASM